MSTKRSWYEIRNATAASADLYLYEEIGIWGITAADFLQELKGLQAGTLNVHINSPGGSVFDGFAIYNALSTHPARVLVTVDGIAASIASVIAMAGDEIAMAENAMLMIHRPWTELSGFAADLRQQADVLDKLETNIVQVYAARTKQSEAAVRAAMEAETWYSAEEAVAAGFATSVAPALKIAAKCRLEAFNLPFRNAPVAPAPGPAEPAAPLPTPLAAPAADKKPTPLSTYLRRQSLLENLTQTSSK